MKIPFELPVPINCTHLPIWDGNIFVIGEKKIQVLEYSENFSGWSDDLTALHEEVAGDSHPIDIASRNDAINQIKNLSSSNNPVIMEIGCSSGYLIRDLKKTFSSALIIGADVVKEPLFKLAKVLPGVPLLRFDLLKCPLPNGIVDVLIMLNVLEHIEDDKAAMRMAFNLIKPGGALIVEVPAGSYLYDDYDAELFHFRRYSTDKLEKKLIDTGFNLVRKSHLGFLLFPAFLIVKLKNKWLSSKKGAPKVVNQATSSSNSKFVKWIMWLESKFLSHYQLPFGIRVLVVAVRPTDS